MGLGFIRRGCSCAGCMVRNYLSQWEKPRIYVFDGLCLIFVFIFIHWLIGWCLFVGCCDHISGFVLIFSVFSMSCEFLYSYIFPSISFLIREFLGFMIWIVLLIVLIVGMFRIWGFLNWKSMCWVYCGLNCILAFTSAFISFCCFLLIYCVYLWTVILNSQFGRRIKIRGNPFVWYYLAFPAHGSFYWIYTLVLLSLSSFRVWLWFFNAIFFGYEDIIMATIWLVFPFRLSDQCFTFLSHDVSKKEDDGAVNHDVSSQNLICEEGCC